MSKRTEGKKLVPRLRFPEFRDAGEWKHIPLRAILDYERPDKYIVNSDNYKPSGIPVLTANKSFILGYTSEQDGIFKDVPVIIFDDFTTDKKYVDFPFKVKSSAIKILRHKDANNIRFIYELMSLIKFDPKQHKRYYISEYQNILVPVPKPKEQQKIADFLSTIDELIEHEANKLEALKKHKKGLMQRLFPREGERVPRLRFPEFRDAGEWEAKRLEEVGDIITGATPPPNKAEYYENGKYPWVTPTDIGYGKDIVKTQKMLSENGLAKGRFIPRNSLLVTCIASIGKNAILRVDGSCNQQINAITKLSNTNIDFLYYLIEEKTYLLLRAAGHGGMPILNKKDFSSLKLPFPSLPEQQKIADLLSSIDELIEHQTNKLEALKKHKKGLIQQLFPKESEETRQ